VTDSYDWFKRSGQLWKVRLIWAFLAVVLIAGILRFSTEWQTAPHYTALAVVFGGALGAFSASALVRCSVCGDRVVATLFMERPRSRIFNRMSLLKECPVCGDPGDGSNPKHW